MRWQELRQGRHNRWIGNSLRYLVREPLEKKFKKLILFLQLNLIRPGIILPLVTVGGVLFSLRGQIQRIMVYQEGIWRESIIQLVGSLSFVTRRSSRVMSLSLTISRAWKSRKKSIKSDGAKQQIMLFFSFLPMIKPSSFGRYDFSFYPIFLSPAYLSAVCMRVQQVQEKKVKKISDMNSDPSKAGSSASSSNSSSTKPCLANGSSLDGSYDSLSNDFSFPSGGLPSLRLPVVTSQETNLVARCRRVYGHAHDYHINSISNNSDGETFISADDLRINLWNLEISSQSFNIVDVKPANMEDLTEVITSAEFHPTHCNTLAYSSSKGSIRLIDLRQSALCDSHAKLFNEPEAPGSRSFFTEIIASISDIKFAKDGRHILSRDYMSLKLWDINMDSGPVVTFQVHEHLRPKLCDLYENDSIFDKFECCLSGDGNRVATGSYSNLFRVFGCAPGSTESTTLEASKNPMRRQVQTSSRPSRPLSSLTRVVRRGAESPGLDVNGNSFDFTTKLLHLAWHPTDNSIACAAANSLYMYYA